MNDKEAVEVAQLVAKLWPSPGMDGVRCTFYARALTVVPDHVSAIEAVSRLFVDERFQPTPGQVIDAALGDLTSLGATGWEAIVGRAAEIAGGRPVDAPLSTELMTALRASSLTVGMVGQSLNNDKQLSALRRRFLTGYRDTKRAEAAGKLADAETRELTT
jgi:hypothetical protein